MVFSSVTFLFYFLPLAMALYLLLPFRNAVLLLLSLIFYGWGDVRHVPLLLLYIVLNYGFGLWLGARPGDRRLLALGVGGNLLLLLAYKYLGFLVAQVNLGLELAALAALPVPAIELPLGISFFTFQGISYLVDIHRGEVKPQRSLISFAMYKAMFPQLIAGPIVRYKWIAGRVDNRRISAFRFRFGLQVFILGLAQKVLIANTVALPVDQIYALPAAELTAATAWLAAACYMLQIFFDFAGYSNMAIGMAHMMGFSFPRNFDRPYAARSVTEFWRRWHMTLSGWFRDYVYIPLGGNRGSRFTTYRNLLVIFALCGFWHGASWTFLAWGLYHGLLLMLERAGLLVLLGRLPRPLQHLYLVLAVLLGWVLFRADSLHQAWAVTTAMAGFASGDPVAVPLTRYLNNQVLAAMVLGAGFSVAWMPKGRQWLPNGPTPWPRLALARDAVGYAALLLLLGASCLLVGSGSYNPFIYYRF